MPITTGTRKRLSVWRRRFTTGATRSSTTTILSSEHSYEGRKEDDPMTEETPTPEWLLSMANDIEASDGLATLVRRNPNVQKLKPEYYGDMIISTPLKRSDVAWALRQAAATINGKDHERR